MGMDFGGLVCWSESGQDLENRAEHPHQEFPGVPLRGSTSTRLVCILETSLSVSLPFSICGYK